MKFGLSTLAFTCLLSFGVTEVACYSTPKAASRCNKISRGQPQQQAAVVEGINGRRQLLNGFVATAAATILSTNANIQPANAVISSKYCAYGEGADCADLAEGNPLILELQQRSKDNKEQIQREARNAYYMKNYPEWFGAVGKNMIKKSDGTFMVVTDAELEQLTKDNKIGVEYAKAMGGKVVDYTQKPIKTLKD